MNDVNVCPRTEASGESRDAEYAGGGVTFSFPIAVLSSPHCMSSSHFTFNAGPASRLRDAHVPQRPIADSCYECGFIN